METATRIFSVGYYKHVIQGMVDEFVQKPKSSAVIPHSALQVTLLTSRLLDVCRDFDAFFIDDIYPLEENEKILHDRLQKATESFLGR